MRAEFCKVFVALLTAGLSVAQETLLVGDKLAGHQQSTQDKAKVVAVDREHRVLDDHVTDGTVIDVLESKGLSILVAVLDATGLRSALEGDGPFTVFAPLDRAFGRAPEVVAKFASDTDVWQYHLQKVLLSHVLSPEIAEAEDLTPRGATFKSLNPDYDIEVTKPFPKVRVNDIKVKEADFFASNGVVHTLRQVLLPPFATTNIVEAAIGLPDVFSTLVSLVVAADLVDALSGPGPLTVFAPTDVAFSKLPAELVEALTMPENKDKLVQILTYHVVAQNLIVETFVEPKFKVRTLEGGDLKLNKREGKPLKVVGGTTAKAVLEDVIVSNGVVHAIDTVLIPPGFEI